jgi:cytochrome P450
MELYDPFDKEWLKNKFKYYDQMRSMDTAYWSEKYKMYVFTRNKDVIHILSKPEIFISGKGNLVIDKPYRYNMTPGASDGRRHTYFRSVVKEAYSKSRIISINESIRKKATELLEEKGNEVFNIAEVISLISSYMSAEIINLPNVGKDHIADLIMGIQKRSDRVIMYNADNTEYDELVKIIKDCLENKIEPTGEGIYQEFIENTTKYPYPITPISLFTGPVISGCYSMISALQFTVYNLYKENVLPELLNDFTLIPQAVTEALRFNATTGKFARTVEIPTTLHGIDLKVGDRVAVCLDAASRDPEIFPEPNKFDLHRSFSKSTPFGYGPHACAGQAIAKSGLEEFLNVFLTVIGNYKVVTQEEDLDYVITATANNDVLSELLIQKL